MHLARLVSWLAAASALVGCTSGSAGDPASGPTSDAAAEAAPDPCADSAGALAGCLAPKRPAAEYVQQAELYFDTLDARRDPAKVPNYSLDVVRWEWPPWLKLTGYGRDLLVQSDRALTARDPTTTVPVRDCRAFSTQPFARCRVEFDYAGKRCPIYEEFFFNDAGETTFIEAWSDMPGSLPMSDANDLWGEGPGVHRLGSKVPTLGSPAGDLDTSNATLLAAAASDAEIADLLARTKSFFPSLASELNDRGGEAAMYAVGCGWPDAGATDGGDAGDGGADGAP